MPVFTMTMFTIAQVGKQPKTHQWRNGFFLCHTDTQWDVFQPLKKKETFCHLKLEVIVLNEIS